MNEHCWYIEKWENKLRFNKNFVNTSHCMIDNDIPFSEEKYNEVVQLFKEYKKKFNDDKNFENMCKNYEKYKDVLSEMNIEQSLVKDFEIDWDKFYSKCRQDFLRIVPNQVELANYLVELVYNKMNGAYYNLLWEISSEGILTNLRKNRVKPVLVPEESKDKNGIEYLGRYYKLVEYKGCI